MMPSSSDLTVAAFAALRGWFFEQDGSPRPFDLRPKRNTQDDPLDEYLAQHVLARLPGVRCLATPGPLITPDLVLHRATVSRWQDTQQIVGIEVKKMERTAHGAVARASGLDFNTTPPCGRIRVYDRDENPVDIRGFYLFICLDPAQTRGRKIVSALALADGSVLNEDFDLYLSVIGERTKRIGLGTFADGADRARPMLIFGNPLGIPEFDRAATLIHADDALANAESSLVRAYVLRRSVSEREQREYSCYRDIRDFQCNMAQVLTDPFPTPTRDTRTRPRGRFVLPFKIDQ